MKPIVRMIYNLANAILFLMEFLELLVSTAMHICFGLSIFSFAILGDLINFFNGTDLLTNSVILNESNSLDTKDLNSSTNLISGDIPLIEAEKELLSHNPTMSGEEYDHDLSPIVLVHGIFGFGHGKLGGLSYFAGAEEKDKNVLVPDLGSLTSIHDRACELFYYLKGGRVDYGHEHSMECHHNRFGKTYERGHFEKWDSSHPIHFIAHSSGVQVVRLLQNMLSEKYFEGHDDTNENWVASITSLSGALNGTTRVYMDGLCPKDGKSICTMSLLQVLRIGVLVYEWVDILALKKYYSFGFDHYRLGWRKTGITGLVHAFMDKSGPFAFNDWIVPDLSIQTTAKINQRLKTFPNTYYFSYATVKTRRILGRTMPDYWGVHPLFQIRAFQMSQWRHPSYCELPHASYRDEDWHDNDGALNTISMLYPRVPEIHPHKTLDETIQKGESFEPGIWYYTLLDADHLKFIFDRKRAGVHFDVLYDSIFQRCRQELKSENSTSTSTSNNNNNNDSKGNSYSNSDKRHRLEGICKCVVQCSCS